MALKRPVEDKHSEVAEESASKHIRSRRSLDGVGALISHPNLREDRESVLAAVKTNGLAIAYAAEALKQDRKIALEAVRQDGSALQFLPQEFRSDRELVLLAVQQ